MATITENLLGPSGRMISNDSTNLMKDEKNRNKSENGNESENGKDPLIFGFLMSNQFVLQITCASFLLFHHDFLNFLNFDEIFPSNCL